MQKFVDWARTSPLAGEVINKAGGVNGKKLEMIVLDTQADPQLGIQMTNRLVSVEKVPVFITAWSGVVKAGDHIVLTIGEPIGKAGGTNTMKIVKVGKHG